MRLFASLVHFAVLRLVLNVLYPERQSLIFSSIGYHSNWRFQPSTESRNGHADSRLYVFARCEPHLHKIVPRKQSNRLHMPNVLIRLMQGWLTVLDVGSAVGRDKPCVGRSVGTLRRGAVKTPRRRSGRKYGGFVDAGDGAVACEW
jgi:hypothetical protein